MHDQYSVGEPAILTLEVIDKNGQHATPTAIGLTITLPDGNTVNKAIGDLTLVSTGIYEYSYETTLGGVHTFVYTASGGGVDIVEAGHFLVGPRNAAGPCEDWIGPSDVFRFAPASDIPEAQRDYGLAADVAAAATRLLFVLTDRVYTGICEDVVRPCRQCAAWGQYGWVWHTGWGVCGCGAATYAQCGCGHLSEVELPQQPVLGVAQVLLDGTELLATGYAIHDQRWLVRIGLNEVWPGCQDLTGDPDTDDDTFEVSYFYGALVPADGVLAAQELAAHLYADKVGVACALPANVASLVRAGVTFDFGDPSSQLSQALLSLGTVDKFLTAERYGRSHRATLSASPDSMPLARRVG